MSSSVPSRRRREPPVFRTLAVRALSPLSPFMMRVTLGGADLEGFEMPKPAASVRLLLPSKGADDLVKPVWNGNEFLLPDGERPVLRTFTPRRFDPEALELDIDIVLHEGGAASAWVEAARVGSPVAVSGPGRGYQIDSAAPGFFLAGDETALPAIGQLLEEIDNAIPVGAVVEIAHPEARLDLPDHAAAEVSWVERAPGDRPGAALARAVIGAEIAPGTRVWVAGEAGSLVAIRKHLSDELGLERSHLTIRGYWKHGR